MTRLHFTFDGQSTFSIVKQGETKEEAIARTIKRLSSGVRRCYSTIQASNPQQGLFVFRVHLLGKQQRGSGEPVLKRITITACTKN